MIANIIGFTGTQDGIAKFQLDTMKQLFQRIYFHGFHHGDCIGADAEAHDWIRAFSDMRTRTESPIHITIHPPDNPSKRAFCQGDLILPEKPYLERNKDIVDASDLMIACPDDDAEQQRSGTWSTIRYARKINKTIFIIMPDGLLLVEVSGNS